MYMLDQCLSMVPQHQWVSKLFGFNFAVKFCLGYLNTVPDALSHRDVDSAVEADSTEATVAALSRLTFTYFDLIRHASTTAPDAV